MTFNAWFSSLPNLLKLLVILGIAAGSLAVSVSFVLSGWRIWRLLGDGHRRRNEKK
jgi:peptidoglycan/LPS O-acetylase OafA/YrhL